MEAYRVEAHSATNGLGCPAYEWVYFDRLITIEQTFIALLVSRATTINACIGTS
jgi:hypothetical protein